MLAIPVFRARVAPVLDWCSKVVIFAEDASDMASGRQVEVAGGDMFGLMRMLREQEIRVLICGAVSPEMLAYGEGAGLEIIYGIAGEIEEVLRAYREGSLDQPRFRLPGCPCKREFKHGAKCAGGAGRRISRGKEPAWSDTGPVRQGSDGPLGGRRACCSGPGIGGSTMRLIAITSEGPNLDDRVDTRFGRAAGFVIVDLENMETRYIDNGATQVMSQGAGIRAAEILAGAGAEFVLTGFVGPKAFQALSAAKIKVVRDLEDGLTVREAVERFRSGALRTADGPNRSPGR